MSMYFPFGGYPVPSAENYAKGAAGEIRTYRPLEPTFPTIDVRVIGHLQGHIIVEPTVPSAATSYSLRDVSGFSASAFLVRPLGKHLMLVGAGRLFRPAPADPHYPHACPRCGGPAYLGAAPAALDCKRGCRPGQTKG